MVLNNPHSLAHFQPCHVSCNLFVTVYVYAACSAGLCVIVCVFVCMCVCVIVSLLNVSIKVLINPPDRFVRHLSHVFHMFLCFVHVCAFVCACLSMCVCMCVCVLDNFSLFVSMLCCWPCTLVTHCPSPPVHHMFSLSLSVQPTTWRPGAVLWALLINFTTR